MKRRFMVLAVVLICLTVAQAFSILGVVICAGWPPYRTVIGPQSVIVITVDFSDTRGTVSTNSIRDMVFIKISNYFREVSYNQTWIVGDITREWYQLPGTSASYEWDGKSSPWSYFQPFITAVVKMADAEVDYSKYRFVAIVHSGKWRSSWGFVDPYKIQTGEGVFNVNVAIVSAYVWESVFAHEFAHVFGSMPDMYGIIDGQYLPIYVGPWCLMSQTNARYVQHLSSWCKIKMGWIGTRGVATVPWRQNMTVTVDPLELPSSGVHALKVSLWHSNAYYLVEVRQKIGLDNGLPDQGVLIYLVDETKTVWGQSVLAVQDSSPETRTLDDAPFDLRPGKQAAFFDRENDVSIVILGRSGLSYTIFAGPVSLGELAVKHAEKFLLTIKAIEEATASIQRATNEGRTEGLDKAKYLLANSSAALEKGDYDTALAFAKQAREVADAAAYSRAYYEARDLLAKARDLRSRALSYSFSSPEAQNLARQASATYESAEKAFSGNDFNLALIQAQNAIGFFESAFAVESEELKKQQTRTYLTIGVTAIAILVVAVSYVQRKKRKRQPQVT